VDPILLGPNRPETFYRGAGRIAAFRGPSDDRPHDSDRPEDWIASTTPRFGHAPAGMTRLSDGALLADVIAADPLGWLGAEHVARFGASSALLVKLLDAGQRLPVHAHPNRAFATAHLASPYGKTEAWVVLEAATDAVVHLGFSRDIGAQELAGWVTAQDVASLLAATNRVPVTAGDALLCPAGLPHAIGEGILLLELQEPTDFSVLLEWDGFPLTADEATLGLSMDVALECVDRHRCSPAQLEQLRGRPATIGALLPSAADEFFVAERVAAGAEPAGFVILVVTAGAGELRTAGGYRAAVGRGETLVIPYAAGAWTLDGDLTAIACRSARSGH
jgi:mannose-6-phosphate isomerase